MAKLRVHRFSVPAEGYGAGAGQRLEYPLGVGGDMLARAAAAARRLDVHLGGGVDTIRQHPRETRVDATHIPVAFVLRASGEALFTGTTCRRPRPLCSPAT
ncbi:MAG: hypothetical protein U1F58_08405 [Burkholderiales bacterium]